MIELVESTIKKYGMLKRGDTVIAAVSGGADSMAMLHALDSLKGKLGIKIIAAHLNHNLRGAESEGDSKFVKNAARRLGVRFIGARLKKGELYVKGSSIQEAARLRRYEFLEDAAARCKADKIALGHTLDDQAETVLMRLIKGSSLNGLAGIPPVRDRLIRPLMEVKRAEIERYASLNGIRYRVDSSNLRADYLRNSVRQRLIPFIAKGYNPNIISTLGAASALLRHDADYLDGKAEEALSRVILDREKDRIIMDRVKLKKLHPAVSSRVFLKAVQALKKKPEVYGIHVEIFFGALDGVEKPNASFALPGGLHIIREYGRIIVSSGRPEEARPFDVKLKVPGTTLIKGAGCLIRSSILKNRPRTLKSALDTAYFDYDALRGAIRARSARAGDRIIPFGMKGHKKIKEVFIEKKIPAHERKRIPVVYAADAILWVAGLIRSEECRVGGGGGGVLRLEYLRH